MTYAEWNSALAPKVTGTWNIHVALESMQLEFFILTSSLACVLGRPGQANYSAANSFLQSFSHYRRSINLPCSVIDIGVMENVGYVHRHNDIAQAFQKSDWKGMQQRDLLDAIEISIRNSQLCNQSTPCDRYVDFGQITTGLRPSDNAVMDVWSKDIRMSLCQQTFLLEPDTTLNSDSPLRKLLATAIKNPDILQGKESLNVVTLEMSRMIYKLLLLDESELRIDQPLAGLELDSLVRIEIRTWWKNVLGIDINILEIMKFGSISEMGEAAISLLQSKHNRMRPSIIRAESQNSVSRDDLISKHASYVKDTTLRVDESQLEYDSQKLEKLVVFLTGATGLVGLETAKLLLRDARVSTVVALIRAKTSDYGLERLKSAAIDAGWWQAEYAEKLEVWSGDLAMNCFGISPEQLDRLRGTSNRKNINIIVHIAAIVDWYAPYWQLSAVNVDSAVELLKIATSSKQAPRYIYIAGGLIRDINEPYATFARRTALLPAYFETKTLAESVIVQFTKRFPSCQNRISIIKPGLVIGRTSTTEAKKNDIHWRVIKASVAMGVYPSDSKTSWLPLQTDNAVAQNVTANVFAKNIPFYDCQRAGILWNDFVDICSHILPLQKPRLQWQEWFAEVKKDITRDGVKHPLYHFQHTNVEKPIVEIQTATKPDSKIVTAIQNNMRSLHSVGYF